MKKAIPVILAVCAVLAVTAFYWDSGTLWTSQYDDAYITYRYATNLAEGHGLVFNPGDRTDAASSFLYTAVLAGFYRAGVHNLEMASFLLNMLAIGAIAAFVFLCAFRLSENRWVSVVLGFIAATHGFISGWAVLGMDTVPFAALLCALAWSVWERRDKLSLALVISLALMRPEGILIAPFWWFASGRPVRAGAIFAGIVTLYYATRFAYYGAVVPNSFTAKNVLLYYQAAPVNIVNTWKVFALAAPIAAVAGCFAERRVWWIGGYIALAGAACLTGPSSDWCRYAAPLFPVCLIAGAAALREVRMAVLVCAVLAVQGFDAATWMNRNAIGIAAVQEIRAEAGKWIQEHANHDSPVLSGDIGAIAYHAPDVRFIDSFGVTSAGVLAAYRNGENMDAIIRAGNPRYIADTFDIMDGAVKYTHGAGAFVRGGKPSAIPAIRMVWGKRFSESQTIGIGEIQ